MCVCVCPHTYTCMCAPPPHGPALACFVRLPAEFVPNTRARHPFALWPLSLFTRVRTPQEQGIFLSVHRSVSAASTVLAVWCSVHFR